MNFKDNTVIDDYVKDAVEHFEETKKSLAKIEEGFRSRMNHKTTTGLVVELLGTVLWIIVFAVCIYYANLLSIGAFKDDLFRVVPTAIVAGLLVFMIAENVMDLAYYGKIDSYKKAIVQLQNRIDIGKAALLTNKDGLLASSDKGWNYPLSIAPSITNEATSIVNTMNGVETLKKGFIRGAKNVLYYLAIVAVAVASCNILYPFGANYFLSGSAYWDVFYPDNNLLLVLNMIATIIVSVVGLVLGRLVWSKTRRQVTWKTLLILAFLPVLYLAITYISPMIIWLVAWAITIIGVCIAIAIVILVFRLFTGI